MKYDITLVTCTKDRHRAFNICLQLVYRQTFKGSIQWIIIDDGKESVEHMAMNFKNFVLASSGSGISVIADIAIKYIQREPAHDDPKFTLELNLQEFLRKGLVESDKVLFIEDDDWYDADYVGVMCNLLRENDMVGECNAIYYHISARKWGMMGNTHHASLCQTGMKASLLPDLERVMRSSVKFIDIPLWLTDCKRHLFRNQPSPLCIGMKGLGNVGIGVGHDRNYFLYKRDNDLIKLKSLIGDDIKLYKEWLD